MSEIIESDMRFAIQLQLNYASSNVATVAYPSVCNLYNLNWYFITEIKVCCCFHKFRVICFRHVS